MWKELFWLLNMAFSIRTSVIILGSISDFLKSQHSIDLGAIRFSTLSSYCRSYLLSNFYFLRLFLKLFSIFFHNYVQVKVEDIEEHDIFFSDHTEVTALNYNPKIYYFELLAQPMFKEGCSVLIFFFNCLKILSVFIFRSTLSFAGICLLQRHLLKSLGTDNIFIHTLFANYLHSN